MASEWLRRHVDAAEAIITAPAIRGNLHNHVLPVWAGREFESIKRSDVAALMVGLKTALARLRLIAC